MFISRNYISSSLTQNLHHSRKLLLNTLLYHAPPPPPTTTTRSLPAALAPNYQLYPSSHPSTSRFDANVVMVLSILLCALICTLCVNSLIRCMLKCKNVINQGLNRNNIIVQQKGTYGVDKRALKTFPLVKYSKEENSNHGLDTECVICLSDFEKGEILRVLPKCNHGFHVKCIDKWLSTNSSCPTCRQSLVDTCQKIIGCDRRNQASVSSSSSVSLRVEQDRLVSVTIVPLEREDMARNYRGFMV